MIFLKIRSGQGILLPAFFATLKSKSVIKKFLLSAAFAGVFSILASNIFLIKHQPVKDISNMSQKGVAVVELFTSQGCSSCPPADDVISRLLNSKKENVYILSYHVDYWDRLGWKDPFSNAGNTQRQSQYASSFDLNSIYTPQVVVNGAVEFVGSDEKKLDQAVEKNLSAEAANQINIVVSRNGNMATVQYTVGGKNQESQLLNIALVQPTATISVKRGENANKMLHHVNIVRALKTIETIGKGSVNIEIPNDLKDTPLQIIAFTQYKKKLQISGATQMTL